MSKVKSAICLSCMTLLVAVLCFVCFVSFSYGVNGKDAYNSVLSVAQKDAGLGAPYGDEESGRYAGGGYSVTYYPEGVTSAKDYADNLSGYETEADRQKFEEGYAKVGALYFDTDVVKVSADGKPEETFCDAFSKAVSIITSRYEKLHGEDVRVSVVDGYAIRVFVPQQKSGAYDLFSYMGEFTVSYGSSATAASTVFPKKNKPIGDFVKGVGVRSSADGSYFVVIDLTEEGRKEIASVTAGAADSSSTMFFKVGDEVALQLTVSEAIDQGSLYISNSQFTQIAAEATSILLGSALEEGSVPISFTVDDLTEFHAMYGENAMMFLYIALGVFILAMAVFFFVRYHLLAFAHLYTYILVLCGLLACIWAVPVLTLSIETVSAFLLVSILLSVSDAFVFETVKKDFALGKTIAASVKGGYKKCLWPLFDAHIALALFAAITYFIALPAMAGFALTLCLGTLFSGVGCLVLTRFHWAIMSAYGNNQKVFANFGKEVDSDEA